MGIAVDGEGNIYVTDRFNHQIQVFNRVAVSGLTDRQRTDLELDPDDMPRANLSGKDLTGANLVDADLKGADLSG